MGLLTESDDASPKPSAALILVGIPLFAIGHYQSIHSNANQYRFSQSDLQHQSKSLLFSILEYIYVGKSFILTLGFVTLALASTLIVLDFIQPLNSLEDNEGTSSVSNFQRDRRKQEKMLLTASPEFILQELEILLQSNHPQQHHQYYKHYVISLAKFCLCVLSNHCYKINKANKNQESTKNTEENDQLLQLYIICQKAAYIVLNYYNKENTNTTINKYDTIIYYKYDNDALLSEAISLLALIAKDSKIRERHFEIADKYGFNIPITAINQSFMFARNAPHLNSDKTLQYKKGPPVEDIEQGAAELQRKACLFLGSTSDGNVDIATLIVDENGLQTILHTLNWFRYHNEVANWGLWAIFILCYQHPRNKGILINSKGVETICQTMKNNIHSMEVQRHGVAIMFDLLREGSHCSQNTISNDDDYGIDSLVRVRTLALNAGMHNAVYKAMLNNKKNIEIMMMGREMLVATDYKGNIPSFEGAIAMKS